MPQTTPLKIKVIVGSTREGRFSEKPAAWVFEQLKLAEGIEPELLDLRDFPMPFFDQPMSPSKFNGNYPNPIAAALAKKIGEGDAFIVVTPEYNHGYPAVLKNIFDWIYSEWNNKPVAFVSYGGVSGARSVEQLRQVVIELQMAPMRNALHIPSDIFMAAMKAPAPFDPAVFAPMKPFFDNVLTSLSWWARALKEARGN